VKTESPLSPTFGPGLGLSSNVFDQAPVPGSAHSTTFPDTLTPGFPSPATQLPNRMNGCLDGHSEFNSVLIDFVNKILVPAVDQMNLRSSPQPSRQSRYENLNTVVSHLMSAAREGLDRLERRRSGGMLSSDSFHR
jgi:hypothetical protein